MISHTCLRAVRNAAFAALIIPAICISIPAWAQKKGAENTQQQQKPSVLLPIDPAILEMQKQIQGNSPSEVILRLYGPEEGNSSAQANNSHEFGNTKPRYRSVYSQQGRVNLDADYPDDAAGEIRLKMDLGIKRAWLHISTAEQNALFGGRAHRYLILDNNGGSAIRATGAWTGALVLTDPARSGKIVKIGNPKENTRIGQWYQNRDGSLSKRIVGGGRLTGVLTSTTGGGLQLAIDFNGDLLVDELRVAGPGGGVLVLVADGLRNDLVDIWNSPTSPLCGGGNSGTQRIDSGVTGATAQSADIDACGASNNSGSSPSGGPVGGYTGARQNPLDRMCEGAGAAGRPGMGMVSDGLTDRFLSWATGLIANGTDGAEDHAVVQAARTIVMVPVIAAGTLGASALDEFTSEGTIGQLRAKGAADAAASEAQASSDAQTSSQPVSVDPDSVSCSSDTQCGGGASGSGATDPGVSPEGGDNGLSEFCKGRDSSGIAQLQDALMSGKPTDGNAVQQTCDNPAAGQQLDTNCSNAEKEAEQRDLTDIAGLIGQGQNGCGIAMQGGADGGCAGSGGSAGLYGGSRGSVYFGFGDLLGIEICGGAACDPSGG